MHPGLGHTDSSQSRLQSKIDLRFAAGVLLLLPAILFTWLTIDGLSLRRKLRTDLAEISHVRYGLLNADRWRDIIAPILDAKIETLDLKAQDRANLRPTVEKALYRLLDGIKDQMSAKDSQSAGVGGFFGQGNPLMVNLIVGALRPHVPEYADVVLAELGKPENQQAFKEYFRSVLSNGISNTFGNVDRKLYSSLLQQHGCADAGECQQVLSRQIREADARIAPYYLTVLVSGAVAFLLLLTATPVLRRSSIMLLLLFCLILLAGAVFTPMIEVEAKISHLGLTLLGKPVAFQDQSLYFQSRSVLEVFQTLITAGRPDMWFVGVLVLMFSIIFPSLKVLALGFCLHKPALLQRNWAVKFLALDSSKWSMADVMALAIFMSFVAFNALVPNTIDSLKEIGGELAIPTDSSKILPGYYLFIGFCLASLFLSKKLERGIKTVHGGQLN